MKFFLAILALAVGASASILGRGSSPAEVAAARAAHLAEVARISGERIGALNAALARAGQAPVAAPALSAAPQPIQDNPDVAAARAVHLAEVARQNGAALGALNAALARAGQVAVAGSASGGSPQPIRDNPEVAAARAAHLAEVARQNGAALAALARANGPDPLWAVKAQALLG